MQHLKDLHEINIDAVIVRGADFDLNNPSRIFIMKPWLSPSKLDKKKIEIGTEDTKHEIEVTDKNIEITEIPLLDKEDVI